MKRGWETNEFDKAETCYVKSLELNPNSRSGQDALNRIRLDFKNETQEAVKFSPGQNTSLKGPYLGQTPPGMEPKVFAPGIVSTAGNFEFSIAFSPDGKEIYFTRRKDPDGLNTMMTCRWEKDGWTAPAEADFCKGFASNEPHITPDGKKLYFGCRRQRPGEEPARIRQHLGHGADRQRLGRTPVSSAEACTFHRHARGTCT